MYNQITVWNNKIYWFQNRFYLNNYNNNHIHSTFQNEFKYRTDKYINYFKIYFKLILLKLNYLLWSIYYYVGKVKWKSQTDKPFVFDLIYSLKIRCIFYLPYFKFHKLGEETLV